METILGVSATVTSKFIHNLCKILIIEFYDRYIHIPKGEALQEITIRFETLIGIPHMWGAIDGTHIQLSKKPMEKQGPTDYFNRLNFHSILL